MMQRAVKGIVLAGGSGTRLYPMTAAFSKQLQPVYDKPMIYYPLSTLMAAGVRDILIITTPHDLPAFERLLGNGQRLGITLTYAVQARPEGIAQAFVIARDFIGTDDVVLILGDNLFHGDLDVVRNAIATNTGATIFGYPVTDPQRYGVIELDDHGSVLSIEEKPSSPRSNLAIPGLYIYTADVCRVAATLVPSARGELEITSIHQAYHQTDTLSVVVLGRGMAWLDTGTPESMLDAGTFIHAIEKRQGLKIGCLEEVALRQGFLSMDEYRQTIDDLPPSPYRTYCEQFIQR